jgi:hypothetical protein
MAHLIMGHNVSGCFGTSLAPTAPKTSPFLPAAPGQNFHGYRPGFRFVGGIILGSPLLDSLLYRM